MYITLQNRLIPKSEDNVYKPNPTFIPRKKNWSRFTFVNAVHLFLNLTSRKEKKKHYEIMVRRI